MTETTHADLVRAAEKFGVRPPSIPRTAKSSVALAESPYETARQMMAHKPPPQWERELREISPISDEHSHLVFAWKDTPTKRGKALGRWVLYDCLPPKHVRSDLMVMLEGAPYWELPEGEQYGRSQFVSAYQWAMWQDHRVYAQPFWILQGSHGGTPCEYSDFEQKLLALQELPTEPPGRGALPFAPWDARAAKAVRERSRLAKYERNLVRMRASATTEAQRAAADAEERALRGQLVAYWENQLGENAEWLAWWLKKSEADELGVRAQTKEEFLAMKRFEETYVDTGDLGLVPGEHFNL